MEIQLSDHEGRKLDSSVTEELNGDWVEYTFESRGGKRGSENERNPDYLLALEMLLERLGSDAEVIQDMLVVSAKLESLTLENRRVNLSGKKFPFELSPSDDLRALRREITKAAASVGRLPNAKGPGNPTRRLRIIVSRGAQPIETLGDEKRLANSLQIDSWVGGKSGPPPSSSRKGAERDLSRGFVYVLTLQGSVKPAVKIGFTSDLNRRVNTLNKEIHPPLTNCHWEILEYWPFASEREAYEFEQELNLFLRPHLISGEREVFALGAQNFMVEFEKFQAR